MAYRNMTSIFLILTLCCAVTHGSSKHVHEFENIQSEDQHLDLNMLEALTHFLEQTKARLTVYKKILFTYIKVRSFKFGDMCSSLAKYKYRCPDQLKKIGIKCSCPIAPNTYNLGMTQFYVSSKRIPKGDYRIVMDISMNQSQVLCIDVHFSLK
ncbi:ganglioside GM2 activator-like isoform X2 [Dreissena polymorpha]|uniref:ganglioside GM2 activator-like isoform X2 n=1 Tax=Dreissena polymorpha TaxID=45954 RepID=UPI00226494E9|nr:ganglioside GM2 activator-like isoform X2 [Dreissena polymorpha]